MNEQTKQTIENLLDNNKCVLFMKGTPDAPQCGFSSNTVGIVKQLVGDDFIHCNILEHHDIREGIKEYGNWPTLPQLYINKELVGGNDIVTEMYNTGELHTILGMLQPDKEPADISISANALENIKNGMQDIGSNVLMLSIDGQFNTRFSLEEPKGYETISQCGDIKIYMDIATAKRANGMDIDWVEDIQGAGLVIKNPNEPQPVKQLSKQELSNRMQEGDISHIYDVRGEQQFDAMKIPGSQRLNKENMEKIETLAKNTPLVFVCSAGNSSQGACEFYRKKGYTNVSNLVGGVSNWFS